MTKFNVTDLHGNMSWGLPWKISPWSGDFIVRQDDGDWVEPSGIAYTDNQSEEFAELYLAPLCDKIEAKAKEWGEELGENWMFDAWHDTEDPAEEWKPQAEDYGAFCQALANANAPSFYGGDDRESAAGALFEDPGDNEDFQWWIETACCPDGWVGKIIIEAAQDAAYDELQRLMEEAGEDEEEEE